MAKTFSSNNSPPDFADPAHEVVHPNKHRMPKPLLNQEYMQNRKLFATENLDRDWSNVVFTDESSFMAFTRTRRTWSTKGNRFVVRSVKHPQTVTYTWEYSRKKDLAVYDVLLGISTQPG